MGNWLGIFWLGCCRRAFWNAADAGCRRKLGVAVLLVRLSLWARMCRFLHCELGIQCCSSRLFPQSTETSASRRVWKLKCRSRYSVSQWARLGLQIAWKCLLSRESSLTSPRRRIVGLLSCLGRFGLCPHCSICPLTGKLRLRFDDSILSLLCRSPTSTAQLSRRYQLFKSCESFWHALLARRIL